MANTSFCKLLNRLLAVKVDMQRQIFDYFTAFQVCLGSRHAGLSLWV